ncbi:MAG: TIGR03085 family protein [Nigerium sp.]|nr:TIGR03085 family protein [Nigerium sp.]
MGFAKQERTALCNALEAAGPDAPTLCEGWMTHDLAAHIWVRENDPSALPGMVLDVLADVTAARMQATKRRWTYDELIRQVRRGPRPISVFALPVLDESANTAEFFVHTEDVRRPAGLAPRETTHDFENAIAKSLNTLAKPLFRGAPCGIVLERTDRPQRLRAKPGATTVTVIGKPSELLLFAFGRRADADVRLVGDDDAKAALLAQ